MISHPCPCPQLATLTLLLMQHQVWQRCHAIYSNLLMCKLFSMAVADPAAACAQAEDNAGLLLTMICFTTAMRSGKARLCTSCQKQAMFGSSHMTPRMPRTPRNWTAKVPLRAQVGYLGSQPTCLCWKSPEIQQCGQTHRLPACVYAFAVCC